jgi:tetratricopeptide (TPR) repeat protein
MANLPPALLETLRLRQAVLVAGARCGSLAGLPAWSGLGERLAEKIDDKKRRKDLIGQLPSSRRPLAALGALRAGLSDDTVAAVVSDNYPSGRDVPEPLAAVARVPWRGVVTTGLDDLWPRALAGGDMMTIVLGPGEELALGNLRGRFLLSLLGRASAPASVCIGARDVAVKVARTATTGLLTDAHRRWSFVFLGFAAGDPDLTLIERLIGGSGSTREHFLLCSGGSPAEVEALGAELAITTVALPEGLAEACNALTEAWQEVEASARPAEEDVEGWMARFATDPADREAAAALARAEARLAAGQEWDRLVALLLQRGEIAEDKAVRSAALREASRVLDAHLQAPERAYRALVSALRLTAEDVSVVSELQRLARQANIWDQFVNEYGGLVESLADPDDSARHVLEMGRIYAAEPGREDQAIASFERVLSRDPGSGEALAAVEGLYRQTSRWSDLARVLREREGRVAEAAERRQLRTERIQLLLGPLDDQPGAMEALEAAVNDDPDDRVALRSLEALYREHRREPERLATLERLLPLAENDEERVTLLRRIAAGHRAHPGGEEAATMALEQAFAIGDRREDTLEALARAYEQRESWAACAEVLDRWAETIADRTARAQLMARAGRIYREHLADTSTAEQRYHEALELDPESPSVLAAVAALSRDRGDHLRAAKFLLEAAERTRSPLEKARILFDAAVVHQDRLDDQPRAIELYRRALDADPEQVDAAQRLAPLFEKSHAYAALEPLLDLLVRKADRPESIAADVADLNRRLAVCALRLGKVDKAIKSYEAARTATPDAPAILHGLADLYLERRSWVEARALYQTLEAQPHFAALPVDQRADLYARLGRCAAHLDDAEGALALFQKAVTLEPPVEARVALLEEIAELSLGPIERPEEAVKALTAVLALAPARKVTLQKLLELHTGARQWGPAVAVLVRLAGAESSPVARAKHHYAAALIERDELGAREAAVELFNQALDEDPELLRAFDAIEAVLRDLQDWKGLARNYRRMIKRLPQDGANELRARLWNSLGVISLRNLGDRESAILALEVASSLDRENIPRHELLADLYVEVGPSAAEKAVIQHQFLISRRPDRIESYQALAALFQQMQSYDRLWCVAGALTYLGHADHYLRTFWERHRLADVPVATRKMGPELWPKVIHPSEDPFISALFSLVAPALALTTAQRHQALGVKRNDRIDLTRDDWFPAVALRYVSNTLEMPLPDLFVREKEPQTAFIYNLRDKAGLTPALVLGHGFEQWSSPWEVVFELAKRMTFLRWERFPRFALVTPTALDIAVRATLALGGEPLDPPGAGIHNGEVERTRVALAELVPQPLAEQVTLLARRFRGEHGDVIDIPAWIAAADLTATRLGFVLSSDLPSAVRVLGAEPAGLSPLTLPERIGDLLSYSVSEEYFAVRHSLGLTVV